MNFPDTNTAISTVLARYISRGHEAYHGEPVSQLEHALQAAELAQKGHPDDPDFILAAFLHDYGHLCDADTGDMDGYGVREHERIGAEALASLGFDEKVTRLVAGHVLAKRYLVSTDPAYRAALSEASAITLEKQGGILSAAEQHAFEQDSLFELHIALRRLDERAKEEDLSRETDWNWLEQLLRAHLEAHA